MLFKIRSSREKRFGPCWEEGRPEVSPVEMMGYNETIKEKNTNAKTWKEKSKKRGNEKGEKLNKNKRKDGEKLCLYICISKLLFLSLSFSLNIVRCWMLIYVFVYVCAMCACVWSSLAWSAIYTCLLNYLSVLSEISRIQRTVGDCSLTFLSSMRFVVNKISNKIMSDEKLNLLIFVRFKYLVRKLRFIVIQAILKLLFFRKRS